jgi:membrane-associated phospholipid phosphatase
MRRRDTVFWVSTAAFALLSAAAGAGFLLPVDALILRLAQSRISGAADTVGYYFSVLGEVQYIGTATLLLCVWLVFVGRRALGARLFVAFVVTGLLELAMKFYLSAVPMPEETVRSSDETPLVEIFHPYPYPSGHMLRGVIFLGTVYLLWPNTAIRTIIVALLVGMAATRLYLGVHWFSDIVGGALLGVSGVAWAIKNGKGGS